MGQLWNAIDAVPAGWFMVIWLVVMLAMEGAARLYDRRQRRGGSQTTGAGLVIHRADQCTCRQRRGAR